MRKPRVLSTSEGTVKIDMRTVPSKKNEKFLDLEIIITTDETIETITIEDSFDVSVLITSLASCVREMIDSRTAHKNIKDYKEIG